MRSVGPHQALASLLDRVIQTSGDSDMFRYAPYCNVVTVCNTLRHLERVVTDLLKDAA